MEGVGVVQDQTSQWHNKGWNGQSKSKVIIYLSHRKGNAHFQTLYFCTLRITCICPCSCRQWVNVKGNIQGKKLHGTSYISLGANGGWSNSVCTVTRSALQGVTAVLVGRETWWHGVYKQERTKLTKDFKCKESNLIYTKVWFIVMSLTSRI